MKSAIERVDIEDLLTVLGDKSPVGVCIIQEGRFCYVNPAFLTFTGYSAHELEGRDSLEIVVPEDTDLVRENTIKMLRGETPSLSQFRVVCKDGSIKWAMQTVSSIQYRGKRAALVNYMDITERKEAEEALRRSEERYRTILDEMESGYYEQDLAGSFTFVNDAMCRLLGYSREELIGMNYQAYTPGDDAERRRTVWNSVYGTGEPAKWLPLENIRKDGTRVFVEDSVFPLQNERGEIIGFRGVSRDVTERKRSQEALRQSEERYRAILEEMQDSYFEVDLGGHFIFVNSAVCRNLGYSREELIGMSYKGFAVEEEIQSVFRVFNEVYGTGRPNKGFAWQIMHRDGSPWFVDTSVSPLRNDNGDIVGFRGVARDVTERKQAEEAVQESEERYRSLVNNVNQGIFRSTPGPRGKFLEVNPALEQITGYSREELLNIDVYELYCSAEERDEAIRELESTDRAFERETRCKKKDGSEIIVFEVTVPIRDDEGRSVFRRHSRRHYGAQAGGGGAQASESTVPATL